MRRTLLAACLLAVAACGPGPTGPSVPLSEPFVLAPGESARIEDTSIGLRFDSVLGDSRCPADAICVWGGDAIVRIEVVPQRGGRRQYDLHTGDLRPAQHGDLTIALVQLEPYPFSSRPIQPNDYRATLRVTR